MYVDWLFWSRGLPCALPCSEFTVSAIKRRQLFIGIELVVILSKHQSH